MQILSLDFNILVLHTKNDFLENLNIKKREVLLAVKNLLTKSTDAGEIVKKKKSKIIQVGRILFFESKAP